MGNDSHAVGTRELFLPDAVVPWGVCHSVENFDGFFKSVLCIFRGCWRMPAAPIYQGDGDVRDANALV
jgi:hypothetical protein